MTAPAMTAERALAILARHIEDGHVLAKKRAGEAAKAYAKRGAPQVTADRMAEHARVRLSELEQARAFFAAMAERTTWRPIETAPKNALLLLRYRNGRIVIGEWIEDLCSPRPRPYWHHDLVARYGTRDAREFPPIEWMYIPANPEPQP